MKMTGLCWMPAVLVFLFSAQTSFGAVDQNWLTSIVEGLKNEYALGEAFTLAMNIPQNQDPAGLKQVLQNDPVDKVKEAVSQGQVYQGTSVIAATNSDGLSRVLENIQSLKTNDQGNVLVIYSEVAPSSNDNKIEDKISYVTQNWNSFAFVFSKVADVPAADTSQLAGSFKLLEISKLGLDNIFRCYKPSDSFQCTSCSSGGDVTPSCVANSAPSNLEQGTVADTSANVATGTDVATSADAAADADDSSGAIAGDGVGAAAVEGVGVDTGAGAGVGVGTGGGEGAGVGENTGIGEGEGAGAGGGENTGIGGGEGAGAGGATGLGLDILRDISTGFKRELERQGKAGKTAKCKGRKQDCRRKRGKRKRKAGNVRRSRKGKPWRKGRKQGKYRGRGKGGRRRGSIKGRKSGKRRGGRKGRKSTKRRGGRKGRKSSKRRGGRKGRKSTKRRGGRKGRKSSKRRGGGKRKKWGKRRGYLWEW